MKPVKWRFVIADGNASGVEIALNMMRMLWDGQTSRHGGLRPTRDETPDEARAAVQLAAPHVQLGVSGAFDVAWALDVGISCLLDGQPTS